jgi:DNA mismatch repair protein MutS2
MAGLIQVSVIHGKGTGMLRQTVRRVLGKHPLVKSFRPGGYGEGGEGVTIVELADK